MLVSTRPSSAVSAGPKGNRAPVRKQISGCLGIEGWGEWGATTNKYGRRDILRVSGAGGTDLGRL